MTTDFCVEQYEPAGDPVHRSARKHRIGRASARHVLATAEPSAVTTTRGTEAWRYTGPDERERELEIIALDVQPPDGGQAYLLVIYVIPTQLRGEAP